MSFPKVRRGIVAALVVGVIGCASVAPETAQAVDAGPDKNRIVHTDASGHQTAASGNDQQTDLLLSLIVTWLSSNFDLPANYDHPRLLILPADMMSALRYGSVALDRRREVVATYHDKHRAIYVSRDWNGRTPAGISVLVHEMVHHLQNLDNRSYDCPQARERLAYVAQQKWLGLFGRSLQSEFDIDAATVKLSTACM